jgi:cell division protein FtsI (penicillin-binding protein 3)
MTWASPGLLFGPREMRLYPNGAVAAHILGGAGFGQEAVNAAEVVGVAGSRRSSTTRCAIRPGRRRLALSIDLTVQAAVEEVLAGGMALMNASGASAVLMDIRTGEIVAMASLPDFDPNARPRPLTEGDQADSPLFNRAVQGVYELARVFKTFTIAQALGDAGLWSTSTT